MSTKKTAAIFLTVITLMFVLVGQTFAYSMKLTQKELKVSEIKTVSDNAVLNPGLAPAATIGVINYGITDYGNYLKAVVNTSDTGYLMCADLVQDPLTYATPRYVYAVKIGSGGVVQWRQTFGSALLDFHTEGVEQTSDGGYAITGFGSSGTSNVIFLMKLDSAGNLLWSRTYGSSISLFGCDLKQCSDLGYIIVVRQASGGLLLAKTDSSGNLSWAVADNTPAGNYAKVLIERNTGNYVVFGDNGMLYKFAPNGAMLTKVNSPAIGTQTIIQTSDNGFALAGAGGDSDITFAKLDNSFGLLWSSTYTVAAGTAVVGGQGDNIEQTSDGGYVYGVRVYSPGMDSDIAIVKIGGDAALQNFYTLNISPNDYLVYIHAVTNGYTVFGNVSAPSGWSDNSNFFFCTIAN